MELLRIQYINSCVDSDSEYDVIYSRLDHTQYEG